MVGQIQVVVNKRGGNGIFLVKGGDFGRVAKVGPK